MESAAGGADDLVTCCSPVPLRRLLTLTGLTGVFSVHARVDQAVQTARGFRC